MKRLQAQYRGDRQKLNEEMMKLYQEHKVNPLASCLPLLLQMPVFFIMYRVLKGLSRTYTCSVPAAGHLGPQICIDLGLTGSGKTVFDPDHISKTSALYKSLTPRPNGINQMLSIGLDLSKSPAHFIIQSFGKGLIYATLVVLLGLLYFAQQKMVASRAAVSPTMSATQVKMMQYLPVVFAAFQLFFLTGLVIYYITQAVFRIGQNFYITKRFYHGEESLGKQAQAAGIRAREEAKASGTDTTSGGGGMFAQAKRDAQAKREAQDAARKAGGGRPAARGGSGRTTPAGTTTTTTRPGKPAKPAPAASTAARNKPEPAKPQATKQATKAQPNASSNGSSNGSADKQLASSNGSSKGSGKSEVAAVEPQPAKGVTPPKARPTPSSRPQRPTPGRPGAPARPKPPTKND
jgi:YidC/Oxa1 family membrane protein insertase